MAKRKNSKKTPEETQRVEKQRERARIMEEADAAAELLGSGEWDFLNRICTEAGRKAAIALAKILDDGTIVVKKGGEVLLTKDSQLLYAKLLSWELNFVRTFLESPQRALNLQVNLEAKDREEQERLAEEELNEFNLTQENE